MVNIPNHNGSAKSDGILDNDEIKMDTDVMNQDFSELPMLAQKHL